jgi:hypothetical protein
VQRCVAWTTVITKKQIMPMFLAACPGFERQWQEHKEWWADEEPGEFNDIAEFARYLVESFESERTLEFPAAFAILEKILEEGDDEARAIGEIGLIEDLQTISSHRPGNAESFKAWLGPQSTAAWEQLEKVWEGKSSLMDVLRAEKSVANE